MSNSTREVQRELIRLRVNGVPRDGWHSEQRRPIGMKLPGNGGAADIAALANRLLVIMQHERRRFTPRVDYVTSPGYGDGGAGGW